ALLAFTNSRFMDFTRLWSGPAISSLAPVGRSDNLQLIPLDTKYASEGACPRFGSKLIGMSPKCCSVGGAVTGGWSESQVAIRQAIRAPKSMIGRILFLDWVGLLIKFSSESVA